MIDLHLILSLLAAAAAVPPPAEPPPSPAARFEQRVEVVGLAPLPGWGVPADRAPVNVQSLSGEAAAGGGDLAAGLSRQTARVAVEEVQGSARQADLLFRGFRASPLLGSPQGLAVFQDGVRLNEPFGDTVRWDLVPRPAVAGVHLLPGAHPLFGANAMGGAVALETLTGFAAPGWRGEIAGGSHGAREVELSWGRHGERLAVFAAAELAAEDGWRDESPARVRQGFLDLAWARESGTLGASLSLADNELVGNGPAPVELLAADRTAVFTHPDRTSPRGGLLVLRGDRRLGPAAVEARLFLRRSDTATLNGDAAEFEKCDEADLAGLLCGGEDDEPLLDLAGHPVAALPHEAVPGALRRTRTRQDGWGGTLQARWEVDGPGGPHRLLAGVSADRATAGFTSGEEVAVLDPGRGARGTGTRLLDARVGLDAEIDGAALFLGDVVSPAPRWTLVASARYDLRRIRLRDRLGTALDGDHRFSRVSPAFGASYQAAPGLVVFANAAQSTRNPTPVELTCADPEDPCRLPNAFVSDPPLDPVVTRSAEAGLRWRLGDRARATLAAYRAESRDDILFIASGRLTGAGHFANVGTTRRQGVEAALAGGDGSAAWRLSYAWTDATFRDPFRAASPHHPAAEGGEIAVEPGDRLPGVADHVAQAAADRRVGRLTVGLAVLAASARPLRGDEAGLLPRVPGFARLDARAEWRFASGLAAFLEIENLLDQDYSTFGLLGEPDEVLPELEDPRFHSPGAPRTARLGLRWRGGG